MKRTMNWTMVAVLAGLVAWTTTADAATLTFDNSGATQRWNTTEDNWVAVLVASSFFGGFLTSAVAFALAVMVKVKHERRTWLWLPLSVFPALLAFLVLGEAFWWE